MTPNQPPSVWGAGYDAAKAEIAEATHAFMLEDLAKSGLEPSDGQCVLTKEGYRIPYFAPNGTLLSMYRVRLKEVTDRKYSQPTKAALGAEALHPYWPPGWALHAAVGGVLDVHEGEKKALCAVKHGQQTAVGIGGHSNWQDPTSRGSVHPTILAAIKNLELSTVRLWPDGDIEKHQVAMGWGAFARALQAAGANVIMMDLRSFGLGAKFDDLVVLHGYNAVMSGATVKNIDDLALSQAELLRTLPSLISETVGSGEYAHLTVRPTEYNLAEILRRHEAFKGQLWFNEDTMSYMMGHDVWVDGLTTTHLLTVLQSQFGFGKKGSTATQMSVTSAATLVAKENSRSPFADWLHALRWDGQERLKSWLHDYLKVPDTPFHAEAGLKFIVGAADRVLHPGCFHRWMLVLQGPQGIGKSGVPIALAGAHNVSELSRNAEGKDLLMAIHRGIINNMDELSTYTRAKDFDQLKSLISATHDTFRAPYERATMDVPRRSVMIGSVNDSAFLRHDASGNNRYVVVACTEKFDFAGLAGAKEQLWAEAVWHVRQGTTHDIVAGANEQAAARAGVVFGPSTEL